MAKPKIPNHRKANMLHKQRTERYAALIRNAFDAVADEAARYASLAGADPTRPFSFADYTLTREAISRLQLQLTKDVQAIVMAGTSDEWKESDLVQDLVARKVLSVYVGTTKAGEEFRRYFETDPDALHAFQQRKDNGLNLSERVWSQTEPYKQELEEAITAAIAPGTSAVKLAADVKKYLEDPDKRFRRIKEKMADGSIRWHLSNPAKAYHPGTGRYRSSARNAQRLARTEINMAYRTAEQTRWQKFDFVVGYEVKTTQNGHHVEDICDTLAGKYPKDFKFTGWHPQCMCYCIPILKTEDEFWADGDVKSVNEVTDVPPNFKEWIRDNEERLKAAEKRGNLPYFIRDNQDDVENVLHPELRKKTALEIAAERHAARTDADIRDIQDRWNAKLQRDANTKMVANNVLKVAQSWSEVDYSHLEQLIADNNLTALNGESRKVAQAIKAMRDEEKALSDLIPDVHTWHDQFSIEELKAVKEAVSKTISKLDQSTFESFKSGFAFEADWVIKNSSYATKFVAEAAYKNQIKIVNEKIYWRDLKSSAETYISKLESVNPKLAKKLSKDFDVAVTNGNKKGAEAYIYNLSKWDKIIDLHSSLSNNGTDIADFEKFIKEGKLNKAWGEYNKLKTSETSVDLEEYCKKHYRTTFDIDSQESYENRMPKLISDCHDAWINATIEERRAIIDYTGCYSQEMIVDRAFGKNNDRVKNLDSLLDKVTLKEDLVLRSGQNFCVPGFIFGSDFESVLRTEDIAELNKRFAGVKGVNNGYMSTSYNERGGFSYPDIEFHIFAPKGTNGMAANQISRCAENRGVNWDAISHNTDWSIGESEFILHGGLIYQFIKAEVGTGMSDTGIRLYIQILGRK